MTEIMTQERLREYLSERLESKEWWFIINDLKLSQRVEERHYSGDDNVWFEVTMTPEITISMAHKSKMTARQFAQALRDEGATSPIGMIEEGLGKGDILFPHEGDPKKSEIGMWLFAQAAGQVK